MWVDTLRRAKSGDEESMEILQAENRIRRERNLPTVEEELREMARKEERRPCLERVQAVFDKYAPKKK